MAPVAAPKTGQARSTRVTAWVHPTWLHPKTTSRCWSGLSLTLLLGPRARQVAAGLPLQRRYFPRPLPPPAALASLHFAS